MDELVHCRQDVEAGHRSDLMEGARGRLGSNGGAAGDPNYGLDHLRVSTKEEALIAHTIPKPHPQFSMEAPVNTSPLKKSFFDTLHDTSSPEFHSEKLRYDW